MDDDVRTFRGKRNLRAILATAHSLQRFAVAQLGWEAWLGSGALIMPEDIPCLEADWPKSRAPGKSTGGLGLPMR